MSVLVSRFSEPSSIYTVLIPVSIVNAHPDDPPARNGLKTCMDVLHRMSIAWPSAGRAWELLYGCKANVRNSVCSLSATDVVRTQKRTADHFVDDNASLYQAELLAMARGGRHEAVHSQPQPEEESTLGSSQDFYSFSDRWPGEGCPGDFSGSLSTSVLPQQYSTGFFERAVVRGSNTSSPAEVGVSSQQELSASRRGYPRYWNDFSALSQLGVAPLANSLEHESHQHQQPHPQTYPTSGQYTLW